MPLRQNPWVKELLTWHGHDSGGVQVPFQRKSPLGQPIETGLILKLRALAKLIADGKDAPRWVFLIGGPGNGKSETVQDFLTHLDGCLGMQGQLCNLLTNKFKPNPISSRRVVVESGEVSSFPGNFVSSVGRLVVVQDATATNSAQGNAASDFVDDISDLLSSSATPLPLFVACANRGILTRALREARRKCGIGHRVTQLIANLIRASSISFETSFSAQQDFKCWPLTFDNRVACWPLDFESLITSSPDSSPVDQIFQHATKNTHWDICADCDSALLCPFKKNASWLQDTSMRQFYLRILRRSELYTGQRWNFRDTFSLAAETMVGQWSDFGGQSHPCDWVHEQVNLLNNTSNPSLQVAPAHSLLQRLYPHALFPKVYPQLNEDHGNNISRQEISLAVLNKLFNTEESAVKPIRETLLGSFSNLDPAIASPGSRESTLRKIEDEYSQSVELGNSTSYTPDLSSIELVFLGLLQSAEVEWDQELLGRRSFQAFEIVYPLRQLACVIVKRSIGVRSGLHADENYLAEFETALQNQPKLNRIRDTLQDLLGDRDIVFNVLESFGQPQAERGWLVTLQSSHGGLQALRPPRTTLDSPGHDVPFFEIGGKYRIPISFELYRALCLKRARCSSSSLSASVRAAIDRVRHLYAGELCRDKGKVDSNITTITVGENKKIEFDEHGEPFLSDL